MSNMTSVEILLLLPFIGSALAYILGKLKINLAFWVAEIVGAILFASAINIAMNYTSVIDIDYTWISYGGLELPFGIYVDHLAIVMLLIATGLGFADIHFAHDYMGDDNDQARYYAKVLFFIGGMILLVVAKDLIGAFFGWEFMGLASYLLISFWFKKSAPADAGMQAFLYTRFGDIFMLAAIGLLFVYAGTINMVDLNTMANNGEINKTLALVTALFIFMAAVGKSGQFPLYPWLMNAMEGPTTVSALIHGATMVNSGIYIVARMFDFFAYTDALFIVANVAAISAFIGATSALVQREIKKILAYSTMSHLSIAFVGLGVGSLAAGMMHLVNHAIFKALLFLSAGAIIYIAHHTKDAWKLGGLIKVAPFVAIFMGMGSLSLAGVPPFSGFFSKDFVLSEVYIHGTPSIFFFTFIAAMLSIAYISRLWFLIFLGEERDKEIAKHTHAPGNFWIRLPLGILALVTLGIALYQTNIAEYIVGHEIEEPHVKGMIVAILIIMATLFAIVAGLYIKGLDLLNKISQHHLIITIRNILFNGYYVEFMISWFSKNVIVNTIGRGARWIDTYIIDALVNKTVDFAMGVFKGFKFIHTGRIGDYIGIMSIGVAFMVIVVLFLVKGV